MSIARAVIDFKVNVEEAKKKIADFKNRVKDTSNNIKKSVGGQFAGLVAFGGGIKAIKDVYDQTKKLSDFSKTFSLPINEVSKFNNIMSLFGANSDESINGLKSVQQAIIDFKTTGSGALKSVSAQIGLSLTNADGSMKNSMQVIEGLRQKFKGLSESAQLKVAQELGLASPATLQMLRASDAEYAKMKEQAKGMVSVNEETSQKVQQLSRLLAKMKQDWFGVGVVILDFILKPLKTLSDLMSKFNNQSETTKKIMVGITGALMLLSPAIAIISKLASAFSLLANIMKIVWALSVANPIGLVVAGVVALGVAIYNLIKHWDKVKEFMSGTWDKIKGWFGRSESDKTIPTSGEVQSVQNANMYNNSVNNSNTSTKNNNVNNNFVIKVDSEDMANKINSIVRQSASGVY